MDTLDALLYREDDRIHSIRYHIDDAIEAISQLASYRAERDEKVLIYDPFGPHFFVDDQYFVTMSNVLPREPGLLYKDVATGQIFIYTGSVPILYEPFMLVIALTENKITVWRDGQHLVTVEKILD